MTWRVCLTGRILDVPAVIIVIARTAVAAVVVLTYRTPNTHNVKHVSGLSLMSVCLRLYSLLCRTRFSPAPSAVSAQSGHSLHLSPQARQGLSRVNCNANARGYTKEKMPAKKVYFQPPRTAG